MPHVDPEVRRAYHHQYYVEHIDKWLTRKDSFRPEAAEKERQAARSCYWLDPLKYNAKHRATSQRLRNEMLTAYGRRCACCGESEIHFLTLDHVRHDGASHRRQLTRNGHSVYWDLKQRGWPQDGFRVLCWNCNWATRRGEPCPHESLVHLPMGTQEVYDG